MYLKLEPQPVAQKMIFMFRGMIVDDIGYYNIFVTITQLKK
jgi:hypothetical protein